MSLSAFSTKSVASMPKYLVVDSSILIFYDRKGKLVDFLLIEKERELQSRNSQGDSAGSR